MSTVVAVLRQAGRSRLTRPPAHLLHDIIRPDTAEAADVRRRNLAPRSFRTAFGKLFLFRGRSFKNGLEALITRDMAWVLCDMRRENFMPDGGVVRADWPRRGASRRREPSEEYDRVLSTQAEFCRLHGIDPYTWLVDVLQRISTHPARDVAERTPLLWKDRYDDNPMTVDVNRAVPAKMP